MTDHKALKDAYKRQSTYYGVIQITNTVNHKIYIDTVPNTKIAGITTSSILKITPMGTRHCRPTGTLWGKTPLRVTSFGKRKRMTWLTCVMNCGN